MNCFAGTSRFNEKFASFPSATVKLPAVSALEDLIVEGVAYARAGVMLTDLRRAGAPPYEPDVPTGRTGHRAAGCPALPR